VAVKFISVIVRGTVSIFGGAYGIEAGNGGVAAFAGVWKNFGRNCSTTLML
jgi:hypothetical protein